MIIETQSDENMENKEKYVFVFLKLNKITKELEKILIDHKSYRAKVALQKYI